MRIFSRQYLRVVLVIGVLCSTSSAVAAVNADARYRDGAGFNVLEHAGVRKAGAGIYEIKGAGYPVQLSTWNSFLNGKAYTGGYWNPSASTSQMSNILVTCEAMRADPGISYTMTDCLRYESNPGSYVTVSEIAAIRCDGLVEYAYEWNNVNVWGRAGSIQGTPKNFDISYTAYTSEHNSLGTTGYLELSPRVQRGYYGQKWTQLRGIPY